MSTNYYAKTPDTPAGDEGLHIGQSAAGWRFLFRSHPDLGLTSYAAWREFIRRPEVTVYAESGYEVTAEQMEAVVTQRQDQRGWPLKDRIVRGYERTGYHVDPQGYEFCALDFC